MTDHEKAIRQEMIDVRKEMRMLERQCELLGNAVGVLRQEISAVLDLINTVPTKKRNKVLTEVQATLILALTKSDVLEGDAALETLSDEERATS